MAGGEVGETAEVLGALHLTAHPEAAAPGRGDGEGCQDSQPKRVTRVGSVTAVRRRRGWTAWRWFRGRGVVLEAALRQMLQTTTEIETEQHQRKTWKAQGSARSSSNVTRWRDVWCWRETHGFMEAPLEAWSARKFPQAAARSRHTSTMPAIRNHVSQSTTRFNRL